MHKPVLISAALLLISSSSFACGTIHNWMDVYEGVASNNPWRDKSSQLDALAMMQSCGNLLTLEEEEQGRLLGILTHAMHNRVKIMGEGSSNSDLASESARYHDDESYNILIKTIFKRFDCLSGIAGNAHPRFSLTGQTSSENGTTIYEYFGRNLCH